jgi:hypothetical protein
MFKELKHTLSQSSTHLVVDAAGAASLVVLLLVSLHLPGLI